MQVATITSKNQLTLPVDVVRKIGLKIGQKVIVAEERGRVVITPAQYLVEELAGSLKLPKKWKNKSIDELIESSKAQYFKKRE